MTGVLSCARCTWTKPLTDRYAWAKLVNHMRLVHETELEQDTLIRLRVTETKA